MNIHGLPQKNGRRFILCKIKTSVLRKEEKNDMLWALFKCCRRLYAEGDGYDKHSDGAVDHARCGIETLNPLPDIQTGMCMPIRAWCFKKSLRFAEQGNAGRRRKCRARVLSFPISARAKAHWRMSGMR